MTFVFFLSSMMLLPFLFVASASNQPLENIAVIRYIDISTQLVVINSQIEIINNYTYQVNSYAYIVEPEWVDDLAYIEVFDYKKNPLVLHKSDNVDNYGKIGLQYDIFLPYPLSYGETTKFFVTLVITNYLKSYPGSVKQNDKHMVLFPFNIFYYSMYFSQVQTTYLYMGTTKAALIDGTKYTLASDSKYGLQYGPFNGVEPFKVSKSVFHYENNSPFLVVEKVKRFIKISHWGFISVWDQIQLIHSGPKFEGPFKRIWSIQREKAPIDTRIEGFDSTLPSSAFDIYLRDDIGLLWSFKVDYDGLNGVIVSVTPRHILYGGWKTSYEIGYSLPLRDFLTRNFNNEYMLSFPLLDKIFENMVIKEAEINIILPEGASFKEVDPQFDFGNKTNTRFCYYFDTTCREVITFWKFNLVEKHINNVVITYSFSQINLIVKPLTIAIFLYFIFLSMKIYSSLFLSTQKETKVKHLQPKECQAPAAIKMKNKKNSKQKLV